MQCELPRVFIGRRVGGSRRLSGGARIARKPWPYTTPTDTTEGSQRGSQGHEQGFWRRIGGQQSYQAHAKTADAYLRTTEKEPNPYAGTKPSPKGGAAPWISTPSWSHCTCSWTIGGASGTRQLPTRSPDARRCSPRARS